MAFKKPSLKKPLKMTAPAKAKMGVIMKEFKMGKLNSGKNGPIVKNPKQAIAIGLSQARRMK